MKRFHAERLAKLARFLKTVESKHFDLSSWCNIKCCDGKDVPENDVTIKIIEANCGSTACALGWAAIMPEFRKKGLKLSISNKVSLGISNKVSLDTTRGHFDNFDAGVEFFGLNDTCDNYISTCCDSGHSEDEYLFDSSTYEADKNK